MEGRVVEEGQRRRVGEEEGRVVLEEELGLVDERLDDAALVRHVRHLHAADENDNENEMHR